MNAILEANAGDAERTAVQSRVKQLVLHAVESDHLGIIDDLVPAHDVADRISDLGRLAV